MTKLSFDIISSIRLYTRSTLIHFACIELLPLKPQAKGIKNIHLCCLSYPDCSSWHQWGAAACMQHAAREKTLQQQLNAGKINRTWSSFIQSLLSHFIYTFVGMVDTPTLILANIFQGISNALIYIAGECAPSFGKLAVVCGPITCQHCCIT